ncbi:hypothetical protein ACFFUB_09600 [Algimonas porphyrae]|uniref:Secreted protein n=1 Tax=Algimonas porphyrae TaxID=1128113 RepID=A0ABQ5V253_9PROT|nr:hypothetical protein [Algimonas porphyrae]GLQ21630.1 hypothetical protein GCM10007854_25850 [Algimonas porphyrae]
MIASAALSSTVSALAIALVGFVIALPILPSPNGSTFIEARLCTSGRTIRIELPGQNDPEPDAPMPCHTVCARDDDGGDNDRDDPDDDA